jgi:hypothetical protein
MDQGLDSQGGWITPSLLWSVSKSKCKKTVMPEDQNFSVRSTAKRKLKQIDFHFDGRELRGLEQNPDTKSLGKDPRPERKCSSWSGEHFHVAVKG